MKQTIINLNDNGKKRYTTTVDVARELGISLGSSEYEALRDKLIDYSHKSSIFSYYETGETNPDKYSLRCNNDWYYAQDIEKIMTILINY